MEVFKLYQKEIEAFVEKVAWNLCRICIRGYLILICLNFWICCRNGRIKSTKTYLICSRVLQNLRLSSS